MTDWLYKATNAKVNNVVTAMLASRQFLCRSAYDGQKAWADNVRKVRIGDRINFYFVERKLHEIGLFEVIEKMQHLHPERFGDVVSETALYVVEDPEFITTLDPDGGYKPDPVFGKYTGWLIRRVGPAARYDGRLFPARATLVARR